MENKRRIFMKKFVIGLFMLGIVSNIALPVCAECNCTAKDILYNLKHSYSSDLNDIFETMLNGASFGAQDAFAGLIYDVKDETEFKNALKYYINNNCSVSGNQIICR